MTAHSQYRIRSITPAVGAAGQTSPSHTSPQSGTTHPTADDVRALEGSEMSRADIERLGQVDWQDEKTAILHAGGMSFRMELEPR